MVAFERVLMLFFLCCALGTCDYARRGQKRKSRFISFDTDKNDIEVSLDFNVPFLSIPIKKAVDSLLGGGSGLGLPKVNINPASLAFGGLVVFMTSVFLPLFTKGFDSHTSDHYYRVLDKEDEKTSVLMELGSHLLSTSTACPMRIACWVAQRSQSTEYRRTVEKIIRNEIFASIVNTTSIEEAISAGEKGNDCSSYEPCPIREEYLPMLLRNFAVLTNT